MILFNLHDDVARHCSDVVRIVEAVAPEVPRNERWKTEAEQRHQNQVISATSRII